VLEGALQHKTVWQRQRAQAGQIQLMSAGSGVAHSEFKPSGSDPLHFLQIMDSTSRTWPYSELH